MALRCSPDQLLRPSLGCCTLIAGTCGWATLAPCSQVSQLSCLSTVLLPWLYLYRAFDVELLYIAQQLKVDMDEVAVNWKEIEGMPHPQRQPGFALFVALGANVVVTSRKSHG